jgi:AcrR family transcriptional regulator
MGRVSTHGYSSSVSTWQAQLEDARSGLRRAIQDAALRLIAERGMPDVSMSAVAQEAGVSRQTLYNHYPDLETIVLDAARSQIETAGRLIGDFTSTTPDAPAALDIYIRGTLAAPTDRQVTVAGGGMSPQAEEAVFEMLEPIHLHLRDILRRGVEEGSFRRDLEPEGVSEVIFHMIGAGRRLIHMGRDRHHVIDTIARLIYRAVAV